MDPVTIFALLMNVQQAVSILQKFYETLRDAPEGLAIVISQASVFERELDRLSTIQLRLPEDRKEYLQRQINTPECRDTISDLKSLVSKIRPSWEGDSEKGETEQAQTKLKFKETLNWLKRRDDVKKLAEKLRRQADRIKDSMLMTVLDCVLLVKEDTEKLKKTFPQVERSAAGSADAGSGIFCATPVETITWYGQFRCTPEQNLGQPYCSDRIELADATYYGDWTDAISILEHASKTYGQSWANCLRIGDQHGTSPSGFTALHQAAYHGASEAIVKTLIDKGAWRLARTIQSSSHPKYSTPLDVAQQHGWTHLYDILSPVLRRPLHHGTLQQLQDRLHSLIIEAFEHEPGVHLTCFVLPELEVLLEFENPRLWFPLHPELNDTRDGPGVDIVLDGHELIVVVRLNRRRKRLFRISRGKTVEVQNALPLR